jgi:hypothetical protein
MVHVTCVEEPNSRMNSFTLCAANGLAKTTWTTTWVGGLSPQIRIAASFFALDLFKFQR